MTFCKIGKKIWIVDPIAVILSFSRREQLQGTAKFDKCTLNLSKASNVSYRRPHLEKFRDFEPMYLIDRPFKYLIDRPLKRKYVKFVLILENDKKNRFFPQNWAYRKITKNSIHER